jgi:hypothetical protein
MQKDQYGNRQQVDDWFKGAPQDDTIHGTVAGLRRLSQLPQEARDRFFGEVAQDQGALAILDELKTTV